MTLRVLYSYPGRVGIVGIGAIAWHQVTELIRLGAKVTLYCGSCERPIDGAVAIVETMRVAGIPVPYRLLGNDVSYRFHDEKVARHLRSCKGQYDVVHTWPLGALETLRAAGAVGVRGYLERPNTHTEHAFKVVAEEHARIGLPVPKSNTHALRQSRLNRELLEYEAAEYLLCPSDIVAKTFLDRGFNASRIARHQYGYDPSLFYSSNEAGRDGRTGEFTAVFTGRCEPRKGLHYALEAWHKSGAWENGRFIICGAFIPGYRDLLQSYLDHPSIEIRGFTADVPTVMRSAHVLMLPAVEEGSALVTYEARASGCVLMVTPATGVIGRDGIDTLLHDVRDVSALSAQLSMARTRTDLFEQLRERSRQLAPTLTWGTAAASLLAAYNLGRSIETMKRLENES